MARITVGVTGGIAAYKSLLVIRQLVQDGHDVTVVPTESALKFVTLTSFEALCRNPVTTALFEDVAEVRHVSYAQNSDLLVVVPATANTIAKFANGYADNLLSNIFLTMSAPVLLAPAMHTEMWHNPATQHNVQQLRSRGVHFVDPVVGELTGGDSGIGRLAEPDDIVAAVRKLLAGDARQDLAGKTVLITAGGTREALDPVRFLGNRSTGSQGTALAAEAARRGATVTLIGANLEVAPPSNCGYVPVVSTADLERALNEHRASADVIIQAAAVADYRPKAEQQQKMKKDDQGSALTLELVENPDLLKSLTANRIKGQTIIGFAAETASGEELLALGAKKARAKGADMLVVNQVGWTEGFGSAENSITIMNQQGEVLAETSGNKNHLANFILDQLV